jgi:hypothetical protein
MERHMDKDRIAAAAKEKEAADKRAAEAKLAAQGKNPKIESPGYGSGSTKDMTRK